MQKQPQDYGLWTLNPQLSTLLTLSYFPAPQCIDLTSQGLSHPRQVAVIRVPTFAQSTTADVLKALAEAKGSGGEAAVIDLRSNLGGSFPAGHPSLHSISGTNLRPRLGFRVGFRVYHKPCYPKLL